MPCLALPSFDFDVISCLNFPLLLFSLSTSSILFYVERCSSSLFSFCSKRKKQLKNALLFSLSSSGAAVARKKMSTLSGNFSNASTVSTLRDEIMQFRHMPD